MVLAEHTFVWFGDSPPASAAGGTAYVDRATKGTAVDEGSAPLEPHTFSPDEASQFTISVAVLVASVSSAVLAGVLIGSVVERACPHCWIRVRKTPHAAQLDPVANAEGRQEARITVGHKNSGFI